MELFQDQKLWNKAFKPVTNLEEQLEDKIVGLYFSASWSLPCHEFTPTLVKFYNEMGKRKAQFQVVFVPFDKDEEAMKDYVRKEHGNWLIVPFGDKMIRQLQDTYSVKMVPKLIVIKPNGETITEKGRKEIEDRGVSAFRPWSTAVFGPQQSRASAILQTIDSSAVVSKTTESSSNTAESEHIDIVSEPVSSS